MTPRPGVGLPDADRWSSIVPILERALELPDRERAGFLDEACRGDARLRAEVESLLGADVDAGNFLGRPVDLSAVALPTDGETVSGATAPVAGATIGSYRLLREIGRGGMGVVYEAEQQRPQRPVALKVILGGRHVDADAVRLFRRESDSLARLKHPSIASIYESGSTEEGQHFFAMELVRGRTLSEFLETGGPPRTRDDVRRRLALFRKIAAAVAYAHQRGVIHRDLKPSNLLVIETPAEAAPRSSGRGAFDDVPDIKVLDFGLARITDPDANEATAVTEIGRIRGTLPYMSPEQVRGQRDEVDVRTDVYSLGVILYRMLAGRLPYDLESLPFPEAARVVCEHPPRPLRAGGRRLPIDHDAEVIVLKALEKDPARRYATVAAFDDDVGRTLAGQPILARAPSAAYQIRKLVARHKAAFAAAGAVALLVAGFAVFASAQARRTAAERDRANREATTALKVSEFLTRLFEVSDPNEARGNALKARDLLDKGVERIDQDLAGEPEVQARLLLTMGVVYTNLGLYKEAQPVLERALAIRRRILGEEHPDTFAAMNAVARIYAAGERNAEAVQLYERIAALRRRVQGEHHPETLQALAGLASVYRIAGRYKESETLSLRVLEERRRVLGEDHPETIASMNALAETYRMQRRYAEAEAAYLPMIEKVRRVLGNDSPITLERIGSLAIVYRQLARYDEAEKLALESLEGLRRVEGEDHPVTIMAMHQLATIYGSAGRLPESEALLRQVLEARRRVLGPDDPLTLNSMHNLAFVLRLRKRYDEAEGLYRAAAEKMRRLVGERHPDTVNTLYYLGSLAAERGDRRGALDWLGQAVRNGYPYGDDLAADENFESLRGDPAFDALVAQARNNKPY